MISLTSPVKTRAHGWPAGLKLGALCLASVVLFSLPSIWWQAGAAVFTALLYVLPGPVFLRHGLRRLWPLWPFVVLIMVWHVATGASAQGGMIALRMLAAVALANLVTMTTSLSDMMQVVRVLLIPRGRAGGRVGG